jgi:hypothetical protein
LGDFYFLSYLGFLNPPQRTWVVYGISQFREQRSDRKPCITRNEDEDHYLAPPNYRINICGTRPCTCCSSLHIILRRPMMKKVMGNWISIGNRSPPHTFRPPTPTHHPSKQISGWSTVLPMWFYYWRGWWSSWMIPIIGFVHVGGPWIATGVSWKGEDSNSYPKKKFHPL